MYTSWRWEILSNIYTSQNATGTEGDFSKLSFLPRRKSEMMGRNVWGVKKGPLEVKKEQNHCTKVTYTGINWGVSKTE
jgi:hypothetical protein